VIGPYKLLQQIGEGGMGTVYMAEQAAPVRRKVALKIIKPGMDTHEVIARFEAERQALALMDHPNIARVFDGGATEAGRPYFVMELVKGVPITDYCDQNKLPVHERLELFVTVCHAVQHAHQKGIIHRDIKPSNVLVTLHDGRAVPKVIDFGVAKAVGRQLTDKTLFTQFAQMVGTPLYMSPEQAELTGLDIDTRADVYSLGVMLYELLTGTTPFESARMKKVALDEIRRIIREEDPPSPSTRLSSTAGETQTAVAAHRHIDPKGLSRLVRGDLDWIVMKALEKDRNRRYETANGFAADIGRYLSDEPVEACPPSAVYRFRKFARRNRAGLAFTGLVLLILLTLTGGIGWNVRDRAARQAAVEMQVNLALKEAEQWQEEARWPEALSVIKRAEALLAGSGSNELRERVSRLRKDVEMVLKVEEIPLLRSQMKENEWDWAGTDQAYAKAFSDYGIDVAGLSVEEATARIRARPNVAAALVAAVSDWGFIRAQKDKPGGLALKEVAQAAEPDPWRRQVREAVTKNDAQSLAALAASPEVVRQPATCITALARALHAADLEPTEIEMLRRAQREYPGDFWINVSLADALWKMGPEYRDEVISFRRAALAVRPNCAAAHTNLSVELSEQGKLDEAISLCRKAMSLDPQFGSAYCNLGCALQHQKNLPEAIAAYRKAIEVNPKNADGHSNLAFALVKLDDPQKLPEALAAVEQAIKLNPKYADAYNVLGIILGDQGKRDEAIANFRKAIDLNPNHPHAHSNLGGNLVQQEKFDEAVPCLRTAIEINPKAIAAWGNLGIALRRQKKLDEAIAAYGKVLELDPNNDAAHNNLGNVMRDLGKLDEAIAYFRKACDLKEKDVNAHTNLGDSLRELAWRLANDPDASLHDPKRAIEVCEEALKACQEVVELAPQSINAWQFLGWAQYQAGNWKASLESLEKSCKLQNGGDCGQWIVMSLAQAKLASAENLGDEERTRHTGEARRWYDQAAKQISGWGPGGDSTMQAICAFRTEAAELLGINQAIKSLEMLVAAQPDAWEPRVSLAKAYANEGLWEKAAGEFTKAIELKPDAWEPWTARAFYYFGRQQWESAIADFSKAIELAPLVHTNWWHRGHAYLNSAQWDKAAADFGYVNERWPEGGEGWYRRAVAFAQLKQVDKALADLRQAIANDSRFVDWIKTDFKLEPLRSREDFRELLREIEQKANSEDK
jgi:tetratricopeptide (TPR) repeat protein